ncbi:MAG: tRNA (adenosine(37)-N6)-threonylcarbamoyltransferase complex dimerization subunit type 1 TsaB [Bacteroidetes bacterium]|nr:tRNA (adenosine(37)-N6)-threonylcarbamoyltransferase complex dimerization subunit type 1 TsaB [Bacteroidota bacterium]
MILSIETATETCGTALVSAGMVLAHRSVHEKNIHSERLLTLMDEVITSGGVRKDAITAVAVSFGPGSFTGLRIGLSAAKGLAMALDIPIIAVPTLDGIAEAFRLSRHPAADSRFCAMIDAKREESYYAFYSFTADGPVRDSEFAITLRQSVLQEATHRNAVTVQPELSAAAVGLLAERRRAEYTLPDHTTAEPLYLRDFVATLRKKGA